MTGRRTLMCVIVGLVAMGVAVAGEPMELLAALREGKVQATFYGNGDESVRGRIRATGNQPDQVYVQPGTQFWAQQEGTQGMTTLGLVPIDLRGRRYVYVTIPTACTNYDLPAPGRWDGMIPHPCPSRTMTLLSTTVGKLQPLRGVVQLAVWAVANNPTWEQVVGYVQGRAGGETDEENAANALAMRGLAAQLLADAGVDPSAFRMFGE